MKQKNIFLVILVVILSLFVALFGGFILYDKLMNENEVCKNPIGSENNSSSEDEELESNDITSVLNRITAGFWYSEGTIFFVDNNWFAIGKYGSDGGQNGVLKSVKSQVNEDYVYTFEFIVGKVTCPSDMDCVTAEPEYTLNIKLEYDAFDTNKVNITSVIRTENGVSESYPSLEKIYEYAGTNWDEVDAYVEETRNNQ